MEIWRYGNMEKWRYGNMEIWRYGNMDTWEYGNMEIRKYGNMEKSGPEVYWKNLVFISLDYHTKDLVGF